MGPGQGVPSSSPRPLRFRAPLQLLRPSLRLRRRRHTSQPLALVPLVFAAKGPEPAKLAGGLNEVRRTIAVVPSWRHLCRRQTALRGRQNRAAPDQVIALRVEGDAEQPSHAAASRFERLEPRRWQGSTTAPHGQPGGLSLTAAETPQTALALGSSSRLPPCTASWTHGQHP